MTNGSVTAPTRGQALAAAVRGENAMFLRCLRDDLTQEQAVYRINGAGSNIAWIVGHLIFATDHVTGGMLDRTPSSPTEFGEKFGIGSKPSGSPGDSPAIADLTKTLANVTEAVAVVLEDASDETLNAPLPDNHPLKSAAPTVGQLIQLGAFHTGYHAGQVTILRQAQGLDAGLGM